MSIFYLEFGIFWILMLLAVQKGPVPSMTYATIGNALKKFIKWISLRH
jgi:hypothetical protein